MIPMIKGSQSLLFLIMIFVDENHVSGLIDEPRGDSESVCIQHETSFFFPGVGKINAAANV